MIRKIKKYKISLHPSFILRDLKKKVSPADFASYEEKIEGEIRKREPLVAPSAIYNTYSKMDTPQPLAALWDAAPKKAISVSVIASTIGREAEKAMEEARAAGHGLDATFLDSLAKVALDQSLNFVFRLLNEEAKEDHCECTPLSPIDPHMLDTALAALEAHKADITLAPDGRTTPLYTSVSTCFWNPTKK